MKMKTLLVLLPVVVATPTSATDKYVSTEFGFAASFPAQVDGLAIQGHDRSAIQSFLDSFELK
jgi:hypothetical protein